MEFIKPWYNRAGLRWLGVFHLELKRTTDVLALAAFVISISGVIYQVFWFTKGAVIVQYPPEQIQFMHDESGATSYLNIIAPVSFVNKGRGDRSAVITNERLFFNLAGKMYELKWQNFVSYSSLGNELKNAEQKPAVPSVIKSGEAISFETRFAPRSRPVGREAEAHRYDNFLQWRTFLSELANLQELEFRIVSDFADRKAQEVTVYVQVNQNMLDRLNKEGWFAASCWVRKGKGTASKQSNPSASPAPTIGSVIK